ncbi:MAG: SRPBCC family protein [Thiothrix sp.]|nr:SRPBCC family protein [Thiothrix sp.]HPQ94792.1 SRPBCC family protein [Thiolinea sp.]
MLLNILLSLLLILVAGGLIFLALQPATFRVERKRVIPVTPQVAFDGVRNFRTWPQWSPWLMHEPDASLDFSDQSGQEGSWYSWDGKLVGAGEMTHEQLSPAAHIDCRLQFLRPMRSVSRVRFRFQPAQDGGTQVAWCMEGRMPFLLRWMSHKMEGWIGRDFDIGLIQLAMQLGDQRDPMVLEFPGLVQVEAATFITRRYEGSLQAMPAAMRTGYPELMQAVEQAGLSIEGMPVAIYHSINPETGQVCCDMGMPVVEARGMPGFEIVKLPARRYMRTRLRGEYTHLELAWHAAFAQLRMRRQRFRRGLPRIERYVNSPEGLQGLAVETWLDIPVR